MGSYCDIYLTKKLEDIYFAMAKYQKYYIDIDKAIMPQDHIIDWSGQI